MPQSSNLPAILGGQPSQPAGPPAWPFPDGEVLTALQDAFQSGNWGAYHGEYLPRLEEALKQHLQQPHVFTVSSGTMATEIGLKALGVSTGDEVIMGSYDYEPTFLTVLAIGAKPVLIDASPDSPTVSIPAVANAISPRTKAIIASHLHGGMVDIASLKQVAGNVPILEDSAQATGGIVTGKPAGSFGDAAIVSFGGSKLLSAGRGGAVFFNSASHAQRAKVLLTRGVQQWGVLSELQAAVLLPQLAKLEHRTQSRHRNVELLHRLLENVPGLRPIRNQFATTPGYYKLGFYFDSALFGLTRERFVAAMRAEGIAFDVGFRAVHVGRSPSRFLKPDSLANAERAGLEIVMLHHPVLSGNESDIQLVAEAVQKTHRFAELLA